MGIALTCWLAALLQPAPPPWPQVGFYLAAGWHTASDLESAPTFALGYRWHRTLLEASWWGPDGSLSTAAGRASYSADCWSLCLMRLWSVKGTGAYVGLGGGWHRCHARLRWAAPASGPAALTDDSFCFRLRAGLEAPSGWFFRADWIFNAGGLYGRDADGLELMVGRRFY